MKPMQTRALRKLLAAEAEQKAGTLRNIQDDLAPELGARWLEKARAR